MRAPGNFLDELNDRVLVGDGAIGSELFARGASIDRGIERLNILSPDMVLKLHQDYIAAGSRVIETNTFGANHLNLARFGADDRLKEIISEGVRLAREAAQDKAYVAGSVGPLPSVEGDLPARSEQIAYFHEQISSLVESGVDLLIIESFTSLDELLVAVSVARSITDLPVVAEAEYGPHGCTDAGDTAYEVAVRCLEAGADVVGANCGYGVMSISSALKRMDGVEAPLSAYVNAGFPDKVDGRLVYLSSPEYLASRAKGLLDLGVRLIGGCCGTGPEAIAAVSQTISDIKPAVHHVAVSRQISPVTTVCVDQPCTGTIIYPGRILVELDPPTVPDLTPMIAAARSLKDSGIDAITIADNPLASVRVDNLITASLIQRESGMPVVPHITGRDHNWIALQSRIMGAHTLGIRSLLCVTGDPVRMCQDSNTSGVFDVNSISLVRMVAHLNAGNRDGGQTAFSIGVALNPNVRSMSGQINKLQRKIEAGAHFALTQPIFSMERFTAMREALDEAGIDIPIYVGLLPLTSARNADFLHNEVPGIVIPDEIREALHRYDKIEDQRAKALEICCEFARSIAPAASGFYIITPRNRIEPARKIAEAVRMG